MHPLLGVWANLVPAAACNTTVCCDWLISLVGATFNPVIVAAHSRRVFGEDAHASRAPENKFCSHNIALGVRNSLLNRSRCQFFRWDRERKQSGPGEGNRHVSRLR